MLTDIGGDLRQYIRSDLRMDLREAYHENVKKDIGRLRREIISNTTTLKLVKPHVG